MSIDPRISFYFGIWTSILLLVASGGISFDGALPAAYVPIITKWCAILGAINSTILTAATGYSSNKSGPLAAPTPPTGIPPTIVRILIAAFVTSLLFLACGGRAEAQARRAAPAATQSGPVFTGDLGSDIKNGFKGDPNDPTAGVKLTGNLKKDAQAVWDKIVAASNADLKYASQLAANANTPASAVRKQCWDEILATNEQANGLNLKDANGNAIPQPDPKLFTQIEQAAEVIDALSPQGKLYTACAGAAQLAQANVIQFISAAVGGVAGLAKLTPIPGL